MGANTGDYGTMLRHSGYRGRIVSFEPLSGPAAELRRRARSDRLWSVLPYALGDRSGTGTINVAANAGASSSLLPMHARHTRAAPHARYVGTESVPLRRLDEVWHEAVEPGGRVFLKLDVQGYEAHVLRGAGAYAKECTGLQVEASFVPLYEGGLLFSDALALTQGELGLTLMATLPGFIDPGTGQMLQCDLVLFRDSARGNARS
ncbi:FkbM family methyltransferase [Streptomyces sp.]|uniref:FkbM family methyltransferase n=1 Tax=Streptomyces sp. TaxID=1931 RepID=UPI002F95AEF6